MSKTTGRILCPLVLSAMLAACGDSTGVIVSGPSHVRVVNSLFRGASATTAVGQPIDFLIDSLMTAPSVLNFPANSISTGDSANAYQTVAADTHSFVARVAGDATPLNSVYTTVGSAVFLPRQYLSAQTYYTIVVAGVVPTTGAIAINTVPFTALVDDPFPGPRVLGVLQARFKVINAAPYANANGTGATLTVYLTPGSTPPVGAITLNAPLGTTAYRNQSAGFNVDPGAYVLTIATGTTLIAQRAVSFAAGEVRTFVVQSTARAATPGVSNHILTNLLDHLYAN